MLTWDIAEQRVRLADGTLTGRMRLPPEYEFDMESVGDATLGEWLTLTAGAEVSGTDERLRPAILQRKQSLGASVEPAGPGEVQELMLLDQDGPGRLRVHLSADGPGWDEEYVISILSAVCATTSDEIDGVYHSEEGVWYIQLICTPDDRTTRQMFAFQALLVRLLRLPDQKPTGHLGADGVHRLLMAGGAGALVGIAESSWLEVKSQPYDLDSFADRIELAQDVSRFANGRDAALLLLGFRTKRREGLDKIEKVVPLQLPRNAITRYRDVIDQLVYPSVEGLAVDIAQCPGGSVMVICVPTQPEQRKPYLVHGAVVAGRNEGAFISIIERREEGSKPMSVVEIHALLAAGRSVLQGPLHTRETPTTGT